MGTQSVLFTCMKFSKNEFSQLKLKEKKNEFRRSRNPLYYLVESG